MKKNDYWSTLQNPRTYILKKYIYELIQGKYVSYEDLLDRLSVYLVTDKDMTDFVGLLNEIYTLGFQHAIQQQKDQLDKLGIKVNIVQKEDQPQTKIFQSEKSG